MLLKNPIINPSTAVLTVLLGAHTYTVASTHRNKTANVDRIKDKFTVLVFPTKSVFEHWKA